MSSTRTDSDTEEASIGVKPFRSSLFLPEDSEDEWDTGRSPRRPDPESALQDHGVLDLFNDIDNDINIQETSVAQGAQDVMEDAFTMKPLGPSLDVAALEKAARARHAKSAPRLPPTQLDISQPATQEAGKAEESKKAKDDNKPGQRKKLPRLDEGRLLGQDGFPALMKAVKDFKIKGKGYEGQDLDRLFLIYQFWSHQLYPKTQFRDTVERVEKLCHSRRLNVALSVYRDEAHGKTGPEDEVIDLTEAEGGAENKIREPPVSHPLTPSPSDSRPPSEPPSSSRGHTTDFDDDELEAAIQAETRRRQQVAEHHEPTTLPSKPKASFGPSEEDDIMDVDGDWDQLIAGAFDASTDIAKPTAKTIVDEEDIWDIVDEVQNQPGERQRGGISEAEENWEDMYV